MASGSSPCYLCGKRMALISEAFRAASRVRYRCVFRVGDASGIVVRRRVRRGSAAFLESHQFGA
jgi:hypothetical protein